MKFLINLYLKHARLRRLKHSLKYNRYKGKTNFNFNFRDFTGFPVRYKRSYIKTIKFKKMMSEYHHFQGSVILKQNSDKR